MEKIWLKSYEENVPAEISCDTFSSVADVFLQSVKKYAHRPAFANMGKIMNYQDIEVASRHFASYLLNTLKLEKGARVALMMPNLLQYPIALFGILRAGLVVVNVNPLYTPRELSHQLKDSGATAIVVLANFAHTLAESLSDTKIKHIILTEVGDMLSLPKAILVNFVVKYIKKMVKAYHLPSFTPFKQALLLGEKHLFTPPSLSHDDIAFLQYTGGTTGVAKGAILTHKNIIANMQQAYAWIHKNLEEGQEVLVTALPLYHIFSLTITMIFTKLGSFNLLITNPRDLPAFIKEMKKYPVTVLTGVNTLYNALLNHPEFASTDFSTWKICLGGGMAVQQAVATRWQQLTGKVLIEAYGLTETSPAVAVNPLNLQNFNGAIGLPIPSTDIQIRDEEGKVLAIGEIGELFVRGPQVMRGYWQQPEETAKVIGADGFLATGDIAIMDKQGYLKIVDRKKDMIVVSGFNVYPNEVEGVLAGHPEIREVACVGVKDDKTGELVKVIVVRQNSSLSAEEVINFAKQGLTNYKVPKVVEFRDELPKSNVGKILRRELR
jgi:long-chain acyl-CoA synthetase